MSMKNNLVLIVFMYFRVHDIIEGEVIHGTEIPPLNTSRVVGDWYALAGALDFDGIACMTFTIVQDSLDNLIINMTGTLTSAEIETNPNWTSSNPSRLIRCMLKDNSNTLICNINPEDSANVVVFDVNYDSYMAIYVKNPKEAMNNRKDAFVLIVGRQLTLPNDVVEKVKQSNIYQQGVDHNIARFNILDTSGCPNEGPVTIPAV